LLDKARKHCRLDKDISSSSQYNDQEDGYNEDQAEELDQEQFDKSVSADEVDMRVDEMTLSVHKSLHLVAHMSGQSDSQKTALQLHLRVTQLGICRSTISNSG